jgi:hypothetical protein
MPAFGQYPEQYPDPDQHCWTPPPMPPASRKLLGAGAMIMVLLAIGCIAMCALFLIVNKLSAHHDSATPNVTVGRSYAPSTTTSVAPASYAPTAADFTVGVVITVKHCFGSYGCNYTYHVDPTYVGIRPLPHKNLTVVFEVTGGQENQTDNFTVDKNGVSHSSSLTAIAPDGTNFVVTVNRVIVDDA